jgi:hypothetical protein
MTATAGAVTITATNTTLARKLRIGKFVAASHASTDCSALGCSVSCQATTRARYGRPIQCAKVRLAIVDAQAAASHGHELAARGVVVRGEQDHGDRGQEERARILGQREDEPVVAAEPPVQASDESVEHGVRRQA